MRWSPKVIVEIMGLHLRGASFVDPGTPLRAALTAAAGRRVTELTASGNSYTSMGTVVDERAVVNAFVGLHATEAPPTTPCAWSRWPPPPRSG